MAGENFRSLAQVIGRIEKAILGISGLSASVGREGGRLDAGKTIRDQLQSTLSSPAIVRSLQDAIAQGLGGSATAQIRDAVRQYESSIRAATAASQAQSAARQRYAQAYAAAQPYAANPLVPAATRAAITAGTITPAAAHIVGGVRFRNIAQRMQTARQKGQQAGAQRTGARRAAQLAAQRGQQAALGPNGVPKGGGSQALANVISGQGLGGMGTLVGSLFGPTGAVLGFLFDSSLKAVTTAFDGLNKTVGNARHSIDQFGIWSIGGMSAIMKLSITEIQRQIYISRELSDDMRRFGDAQATAIEKWKDFDVGMERLNFQVATAWANAQSWFATNVANPAMEHLGFKQDPINALHMVISPFTYAIKSLVDYLRGKDEAKELPMGARPLTPWEEAFNQINQGMKDAAINNQLGPGAMAMNQRLQLPGQGQVIPGHVNPAAPAPGAPPFAAAAAAGAAAGGAGAAAAIKGMGGAPPAVQQGGVGGVVPGLKDADPMAQAVIVLGKILDALRGAIPGGFAGMGGGP